jgi:hypothetical protein
MTRREPWSAEQIDRFLEETRVPIRIACNGTSGHPVLASLWYVPLEGRLWCATQRAASIVSLLRDDPRCGFEVSVESPPYRGVRGSGVAALHDARGETVLRAAIARYLGRSNAALAETLLARAASETAIAIEPRTMVSWDFRDRMEAVQ